MSAPTPYALAAAERDVAFCLALLDGARANYDDAFDDVMAAVNDPLPGVDEWARATLRIARESLDDCEEMYRAAFDALAALRFAASPPRLVPRALTPNEARLLDGAQAYLDRTCESLDAATGDAWQAQGDLLIVLAEIPQHAGLSRYMRKLRDDLVGVMRSRVADAIDARAPLLAAQWEAA